MSAGMTAPEFDLLYAKVTEKKTPEDGQKEAALVQKKKTANVTSSVQDARLP